MKNSILDSIVKFIVELIVSARNADLDPHTMPPHLGLLIEDTKNGGGLVSHKEPIMIDEIPLDLWKKFSLEFRNKNGALGFVIWGDAGGAEGNDEDIIFIIVNIGSDYYYMTTDMNGRNVKHIPAPDWIPCFLDEEDIRH